MGLGGEGGSHLITFNVTSLPASRFTLRKVKTLHLKHKGVTLK